MEVLLISLQKRGGGALDTLGLSDGLCLNKFRHVVMISSFNEFSDRFNDNEYRKVVRTKTFTGGIAGLLWAAVLLRPIGFIRGVAKEKPRVIHILNFHPWMILLYLAKPFYRFRIICSSQDNPFGPKEKNPPLMNLIERFLIRNADKVIVYSGLVAHGLVGHIAKEIVVMPLGIYPQVYGEFEKKFDSTGTLNILFFGRIEPYKGVDVLINAYEILKNKGEDALLTVAGGGYLSPELARTAEEAGIILKNYWLSNAELGSLIKAADVIVAPYKEATQSGIVMIAISYLTPLIVTNVGSLPDYIEDGNNGFIIEPNDPLALAASIEKFIRDRDLALRMSHNQEAMREKFSWETVSRKSIEVYDSLPK
jgi:glycosyltransferase involved in cell wall biosynthesis